MDGRRLDIRWAIDPTNAPSAIASISTVGDVNGDGSTDLVALAGEGAGPTLIWFGPLEF